jgi:methyl-accepting chemotaxis protein
LTKRTQYIVDRTFQQRVAMSLMLIVLFLPAALLANIYFVGMYAMTHNLGIPDLPRDWGLVGQLLKYDWWLILFFAAVCVVFSFGLVLYYTHRIAGPVYRFRRLFDELAEGKVGGQTQLRKGDCFENLAASVSRANATLVSSISELKSAAAALSRKADSLGDRELGEQVARINRVLERYQVVPEPTQSTP